MSRSGRSGVRHTWAVLLALILGMAAALAVLPPAPAKAAAGCGSGDVIGTRLPLLFVHGFISSAKTWDKAVQRFCSDKVYATAFDYSKVNSNWVTDPAIGPKLARAIVALADASRKDGGPARC